MGQTIKKAGIPAFFIAPVSWSVNPSSGALSRAVIRARTMTFHRLEKLINLHDGYRRVFQVGGVPLLLIQEDGQRYLLRNLCPHKAFPLHTGTMSGSRLRCAYHAMEFDLAKGGRCIQHPNQYCVQMFELVYDGSEVGVEL
jgi:nitrite reductase/ring-hydroxylating ferredoxin subunit